MPTEDTVDQSASRRGARADAGDAVPGAIQVYADDSPRYVVLQVDRPFVIGRDEDCDIAINDRRASRRHAEISFVDGTWRVTDLDSHNGTFVDSVRVVGKAVADDEAVLAIGNTIFLLVPDTRALLGEVTVEGDAVLGPRLRSVWSAVARFAESGNTLHLVGETGTGKEVLARRFHAIRSAGAPFVAVNCAAVPAELAERLFFGARSGALPGADIETEGYLAAADGGVVFLDDIGELPFEVQPKLLRALETREVMPLGAVQARSLDLAVCSTSHTELRTKVARKEFREDLYFRIATPTVEVPPLRERREEIPWLIAAALRGAPVQAHASFVEAALVRPWPGNVRELFGAVASARERVGTDKELKMSHLSPKAGLWFDTEQQPNVPADAETSTIYEALREARGNVTRTAKALGIHRNQLRRWLERNHVDVRRFKPGLLGDRED